MLLLLQLIQMSNSERATSPLRKTHATNSSADAEEMVPFATNKWKKIKKIRATTESVWEKKNQVAASYNFKNSLKQKSA